ncbi:RHS repeat-associated core domain-containing protein [Psychrobacter urativorans]|uniref:RHS repeat-associated core domain-containing protein n=1 Tax=Psychrobacter urativorans TaxID=45610 RepID=UPI00191A635B|nr:RHS repeat-associated core domain-containing protein [Psychrobacter urativorans]
MNTEGNRSGKANDIDPVCTLQEEVVEAINGIAVLTGIQDADFSLAGNLPFVWDRQYSSASRVGQGRVNDPIGWYGQGWNNSWSMHLNIVPDKKLIELIDGYGRIISFSYIAIGSSFYSRFEDIRLHHDAVGQYRITSGWSETNNGIQIHFGHPYSNVTDLQYPCEQRLYCTGQSDNYGNRITLEYNKDATLSHLPRYIKDSAGRLLQLDFDLIKDAEDKRLRLQKIVHISNLLESKLPQLLYALDKKIQQQLEHAYNTSMHAFVNEVQALISEGVLAKSLLIVDTLVSYQYSQEGDLIEANPYLNPTRRFDYKNHIMTAHHIADGISSYYEYDEYLPTGKVLINRVSNGQTYHFDYHIDKSIVTEAKDTANERQTIYHFDQDKRWTGVTDALGNRTTFVLDDYDRPIQIISPDGSMTKNQYSGDNLTAVKQLIDYEVMTNLPLWRSQKYLYDNNQLTELIDPHGNSTLLNYDPAGQIKKITDANGNSTYLERDDKGRTIKQILANGSSFNYEYNNQGELTRQTDCSGNPTHYHYDDLGRVIVVTDAQGNRTRLTYDHRIGGGIQHTAAPTHIRYPDGSGESFVYDSLNRLLKHTDAKEQVTEYQYTNDSLPISRIDAQGHTLDYEYDNLRRLITLTNENGQRWTFNYDKADNLISETRFDGYTSHYDYDKNGQLIHQTDNPSGKREEQKHTYLQRDLLGQLTFKHSLDIIKPNATALQRHHKTQYQYDLAGQLICATSPDASTHLEYDNIGQLISERLTRHHQRYKDTNNDNQDSHIEQTLTHSYDEIGNRLKTTLPDGKVINQLYYGSGHLYNQSITGTDGNITEIRHSERDQLHQETTRQQGDLLSSFGYDAMGRLTKQYSSDHNKGRIVIERDYHYDVLGQLTHLSGQTHLNHSAKNISTANSLFKRNHQYDYDKVGRLTQHKLTDYAMQSGMTELFAFDPASNRVPVSTLPDKVNDDKAQEKNSIHKSGRPQQLITADKLITYTYGIHGQVLYKTITPVKDGKAIPQSINALVSSKKSIQHYYNPNNELVKTITNIEEGFNLTEITAVYYYDALGRRIAKTSDTKVKTKQLNKQTTKVIDVPVQKRPTQHKSIYYLWDGNRQAQEYTDNHVFTTVYEQDSFEPVARLVWLKDELLKSANDEIINAPRERWEDEPKLIPSMQIYHYHNDHLGTPNELTNQQSEVVWLADYEAWGNTARVVWREERLEQLQVSADELQPIRFQGQYYDEETGLHYNRFRYFDPDLGMFTTRDPIGLMGGNNVFQYAPNPTGWIDPLGLKNYRDKFWDRAGGADRSKYQVHHMIPQDLYKKDKVKQILNCHGMGKDDLNNLIGLPTNVNNNPRKNSPWFGTSQHNSSHNDYSKAISNAIIRIGSKGNCVQQKAKLLLLQRTIRRLLSNGQPIMKKQSSDIVQWTLLLKGF